MCRDRTNPYLDPNSHTDAPHQEQILQRERGIFDGRFGLLFGDVSGRMIAGHAESEYLLTIADDYPPVWRNITIINSQGAEHFSQIEQIDMFTNSVNAEADLAEKRRVFTRLQHRNEDVPVT